MGSDSVYQIISDTQLPFEAERALDFCKYIKRHYKIKDENVYHVGDEVDNLHGGNYPKDPDGLHSASGELKITKDKLAAWVDAFPQMKLAVSNHGMRWVRKASLAEIPSQMIVAYQKVLGLPDSWQWKDEWIINAKHPFKIVHGVQYSGKTPYRLAAELSNVSVAFGHLHASAGICYVNTAEKSIWAMNTGCLIDVEAYAFKYNKNDRFKPTLGCGVVCNNGKTPLWLPY